MSGKTLTMLGVGDTSGSPDADIAFSFVKPVLKAADVVVANLEGSWSSRATPDQFLKYKDTVIRRDPSELNALLATRFDVVSLCGNHMFDLTVPGVEDTTAWLREHGIPFVGVGMNYGEARRPVVIERGGTRFGFLAYNCPGPKQAWAAVDKPGVAYLNIITQYEFRENYTAGVPPFVYTWAEPDSVGMMVDDISNLRPLCDVLTVAFHKGVCHTPIKLEDYEHQVCYAAIDAGADLILGHHHHILKGIELYKGKTIFHGLCNFPAGSKGRETHANLVMTPNHDPVNWARRRRRLFAFQPDPEYPTYPFHPEAKYTIIAKCNIEGGKISRVSYLPCLVNKQSQVEILKHDKRGQETFDYMDKITKAIGFNTRYEWDGDEVVINT